MTESSPGHQFFKKVSFAGLFSLFRPGSKVPAHLAGGLERLRLQAQPGSRLRDRVLSWAPEKQIQINLLDDIFAMKPAIAGFFFSGD
ncbi:hypothetical protein [Trinickia sp. Y13]|uniref:hypothetical protein n=1 Tax=Trinickia sp. Y13 TaxID=2917807 RepID=UPI0024056056|nr:hypothetical protein [Trinickia sp. Y13]MDG0022921.1 hypothetical protein [Trinickia sp. Y13]